MKSHLEPSPALSQVLKAPPMSTNDVCAATQAVDPVQVSSLKFPVMSRMLLSVQTEFAVVEVTGLQEPVGVASP